MKIYFGFGFHIKMTGFIHKKDQNSKEPMSYVPINDIQAPTALMECQNNQGINSFRKITLPIILEMNT